MAPRLKLDHREPQTISFGDTTTLNCHIIGGIPTPTVKWIRSDGQPLTDRITEEYSGILILTSVTLSEAGDYVCVVENIVDKINATISLIVQQSPVIRFNANVNVYTIIEGNRLYLGCFTEGFPKPRAQWKKLDHTPADLRMFVSDNTTDSNAHIDKRNSSMVDEGVYVCQAVNAVGITQKIITVSMKPEHYNIGK